MENLKLITADSSAYTYMGRIDRREVGTAKFFYAGSSVTLRFKGTAVGIEIINHRMWSVMKLGYLIDGKLGSVPIEQNDVRTRIMLAENLDDKPHEVVLYKRQDATHFFEFFGMVVNEDAEILSAKPLPKRKIEVFGDSVSAGAVVEAIDFTASCDPENHDGAYDNSWFSYAMITARNLGAQIHNNAQGGIALFDNTGYYYAPKCIGLESTYDKLCYMPEGTISKWNFDDYTPNVVIMAVGQNDPHNEGGADNDIHDPAYRLKWKARYKELLSDLRSHYPKAVFILTTTLLMHDVDWDNAIEEARCELCAEGDSRIYHHIFTRNGVATPGHPRIPEQYEMAEELTAFISSLGDKIWED